MGRTMYSDEAQVNAIYGQYHRFVSVLNGTVVTIIPRDPAKRIIVQSWNFKADGTWTGGTLTFTSAGVDTVIQRSVSTAEIPKQGFPFFVTADGQSITITPAGQSAGTYADLLLGITEA